MTSLMNKKIKFYIPDLIFRCFVQMKLSKSDNCPKVCKTKAFTKKYPKIAQNSSNNMPEWEPKYLILIVNAQNIFIFFKSNFRKTNIPI